MKHRNFRRRLSKLALVERDFGDARKRDWDNHTLPLRVIEIKSEPRVCELGCGRMIKDQLLQHYNPFNEGWMTKCKNCGLWRDPKTGEMREAQTFKSIFTKKPLPFTHRD